MLVGPHDRGIQKDDVQINPFQALEDHQEIPPHAALHPPLPAHVYGVPRPVRLRYISPRRARTQDVSYAFQGLTIAALGWPAAPALQCSRQGTAAWAGFNSTAP